VNTNHTQKEEETKMSWGNDGYRPAATPGAERDRIADETNEKLNRLGWTDGQANVLRAAERQLRDGGIGVDIDVVGLSRLSTSVDWYLDLGVLKDDKRRKRLSPGRKNLMPDSALASAQTRLRNNLYKHSHVVGTLGSFRWVPDAAFLDWKEEHDRIVAEFYQVRNHWIDRYDELVADLEKDYREMAKETYDALSTRGSKDETQFTEEYSLAEFQEAVVEKARSKLPTPADMAREIHVIVQVATWMLPVEAARDALEAERIKALEQAEREERDYNLRESRARADLLEAEFRAAEMAADARRAEAQAKMELVQIQKEAEAKAIKEAKMEFAREAVQAMANPMDEILNGLRDRMYETVTRILDNVTKHNRVVGKQVTAIENMIALFRMLNSAGDDELAAKMEELSGAMQQTGPVTKRDTVAIMDALNKVASVSMTKAETLVLETSETDIGEFDAINI